jgi:predicted O-methyltransferase YrrM
MSARNYLIEDGLLDIRLCFLNERNCLYRPFLRARTVEVMNQAIFSERFGGATDPSALTLLMMMSAIVQPTRILELGTFQGFSTMILADILSSNNRPGCIVTVEPSRESQENARRTLEAAQLAHAVQFINGYSLDDRVIDEAARHLPYDIIYIDSSHLYEPTLRELETYLIERPMIRPGGMVFLHDITLPMGEDRGVGAAVEDWVARHPEYRYLPLTTDGIWPQQAGLGIIMAPQQCRQCAVA